MTFVKPPTSLSCAPRTAWHPLFIGFARSFLPRGRVLRADVHLAEPRAILGVDLTGHSSGPQEVGFRAVRFARQIADLVIEGDGDDAAVDAGPLGAVLAHEGRCVVGHLNDPRGPLTWQDECQVMAEGLLVQATRRNLQRLHPADQRFLLIGDHLPAETLDVLKGNHRQPLQRAPGRWDYVVMNTPIRILETSIAYQAPGHRLLYLFSNHFLENPVGLLPLGKAEAELFRDLYRLLLLQRPARKVPAPWGYGALRAACQVAMTALLSQLPGAGRDDFLSESEAAPDQEHYPEAERDDGEGEDEPIEIPRGSSAPN